LEDYHISNVRQIPTQGLGEIKAECKSIVRCFSEGVSLKDVQRFLMCISGEGIAEDRIDDSAPYTRRTPGLHGKGTEGCANASDFNNQAGGNVVRAVLFKCFGKEFLKSFIEEAQFMMQGRDTKTGEVYIEGLLPLCKVLQHLKPSQLKVVKDAKQDFYDVSLDMESHNENAITVLVSTLMSKAAKANERASPTVLSKNDIASRIVQVVEKSGFQRLIEKVQELYKTYEQGRLSYAKFVASVRNDTKCILEAKKQP